MYVLINLIIIIFFTAFKQRTCFKEEYVVVKFWDIFFSFLHKNEYCRYSWLLMTTQNIKTYFLWRIWESYPRVIIKFSLASPQIQTCLVKILTKSTGKPSVYTYILTLFHKLSSWFLLNQVFCRRYCLLCVCFGQIGWISNGFEDSLDT